MSQEPVSGRWLPTDPWDIAPLAYWWAEQASTAARMTPRSVLQTPALHSLTAIVWTLAAAADWTCTVPSQYTAALLADQAQVGARVWQKRTAWLRQHGYLQHGDRGTADGWQLITPGLSPLPP